MRNRKGLFAGAAGFALMAFVSTAAIQARAVDRKARGVRPGMTLAEVLQQLDGWSMINAHPMDRRAIPHGTGPEFNGYSGELYVLTPVRPDGSETDLRRIARAEFETRLENLLSGGEPWTVYFNFRTIPTDRGILVRFDGRGNVAVPDDIRSPASDVDAPSRSAPETTSSQSSRAFRPGRGGRSAGPRA